MILTAFLNKNTPSLFVLFSLLLILPSAQASDEIREQLYSEALEASSDKQDMRWLGMDGQRFLSLYRDAESIENLGTVILLHDIGSHPDKDPFISSLRRELPLHRWATLALQMPLREEGASEAEYYALLPEATDRLMMAIRFIQQNDEEGAIVVVGHQLGGLMAVNGVASERLPEIQAIVSLGLSVSNSSHPEAQTLTFLRQITLPFLDLYGALDSSDVVDTARERRLAARENLSYRQDKLNYLNSPYWGDQALVIKRIYSWLSRVTKEAEAAQ